jgi:hypothetical protein
MKVLTQAPVDYAAGDVLPPEDLNELYLYCRDALDDVASKRFAKFPLILQCVEDGATPYTQAMNVEELTFRFQCPFPVVAERGYLHANMTCAADVQVNITKSAGGTTPTGCTTPFLSTGGAVASAAVDTTDVNTDKFVLDANTEYKITISSSGVFSLSRFDVILHLATDRWSSAGSPSLPNFDPTLFRDVDAIDATAVAANNTSLTTETAKLAANKSAPVAMIVQKHGFVSGTSINLRRFRIPQMSSGRAAFKLKRAYVWAFMAAIGGGTVTATVKSSGGATVATASANVAAVTQASGDSGAVAVTLDGTAGAVTNPAVDFTVELANSAAAINCIKAYALLWFARA